MIKELKINLKCREDEVRNLQSNEIDVQEEKLMSVQRSQKKLTKTICEIDTMNSKNNDLLEENKCILIECT